MLSQKKIVLPENLIKLAKKIPFVPVGIVGRDDIPSSSLNGAPEPNKF